MQSPRFAARGAGLGSAAPARGVSADGRQGAGDTRRSVPGLAPRPRTPPPGSSTRSQSQGRFRTRRVAPCCGSPRIASGRAADTPAHAAARFPSSASLGFKRGFRSRKHRKGNVCVCRHPGDTLPPTDFDAPSKKRPITKALARARSPPLGAGGARTPRGGAGPAPCPALLDAGGAGEMLSRGEERLT